MSEPEFKPPAKPAPQSIDIPLASDGNTYLHELCQKNAPPEMIREAILDLGANTEALNKKGLPPLGIAIINDNLEIIQCLIDLGAKVFFPAGNGNNFNALGVAITHDKAEPLKLLIKNGGGLYVNELAYPAGEDIPIRPMPGAPYAAGGRSFTSSYSREALPCLSHAVRDGRSALLEILVHAGAFLNEECGKEKHTPLHRAVLKHDEALIEKLVLLGADIDKKQTGTGMTALHVASAQSSKQGTVEKLLKLGADPNAETNEGVTPLMLAVMQTSPNIAKFLLEAGADANRQGTGKETALHRAAAKGNAGVTAELLKNGANPLLMDAFNKSASQRARSAGYPKLAEELEEAEGKAEQKIFDRAFDDITLRPPPAP